MQTTLLQNNSAANNSAAIRGSVLYGGLLGKCSYKNLTSMQVHCMLFNMYILQGNDDNSISSDPTQLCLCNKSQPDISQSRSIYPSQEVDVSVIVLINHFLH